MNKIIEFVKIRKEFLNGNIIANNDVSFYINEGEIHAIAGENGAGKSTLVTMLFGLHKPTSGSIIVRGKAIKYNSAMDAIKDGMGMVHQHFQLVDKFTVAENIVLGNEHYHLSLEEIKSLKKQIKDACKNKRVDNKKYKIKINFLKQMLKNSQEQKFVKNEIKKIVNKLKQKNIIYKTKIQTFKKQLKLGKTTKYGFLKRCKINSQINKLSNLYNFNLKAKDKISTLTVGQEQKVEILKLVYKKSDILIFDEPTSMLTPSEIDQLLDIILKFKKEGKTIIIITHKLDEIKRIADRVSVLRKGHYIGTESVKNITSSQLSKMMVGYDIAALKSNKHKLYSDHTVLEVKNLSVKKRKVNKLTNINFSVKSGEIVAVAGVEGNGQTELVHAITGLKTKYEGSILVNKVALEKLSVNKRNKLLSHIPEDRHKYGMILDLKSYENVTLKKLKKYSKWGFLKRYKMLKMANIILNSFDVRGTDRGYSLARGLSGGNQQKLVVGREISANKDLLISFQATRGLDVGAINYIHKQIIKEKERGKAVLMVSYDLNEVIDIADKVIVLNAGQITGILSGNDINNEKIGILMTKKGAENYDNMKY